MLTLKINSIVCITLLLSLLCCIKLTRAAREPIKLDEDSWVKLMKGEWMVAFHAPWCPACKRLDGEWRKFADWSEDLEINVASADITANPGLNGRFMVKGLPTIYHVKDGVFRVYNGPREHTALIKFIDDQTWKSIEPQSKYWNPDTLQMTAAAYSFRLSMKLRDTHDYLVDEIGLPYYISYSIFALCTVAFGTILGLIIVFIIDQICPPKYANYQQLRQEQQVTENEKPAKKQAASKSKRSKKSDSDSSVAEDSAQDNDRDSGRTSAKESSKSLRKRGN